METECPNCKSEYQSLGKHWSASQSCDYPELSTHQIEVCEGLIMGDACLTKQGEWNARLDLSVVSEDFAREASNELDWLVSTVTTREKSGKSIHNQWRVTSVSHPELLNIYNKWYGAGEKRFPDELTLSKTRARFWYLGDGSLSFTSAGTPYVRIRCNNEIDRPNYLESLFDEAGYETNASSNSVRISTKDTKDFLNWIEPVDDLSYKWETDYQKYKSMKRPYYKGPSSKPDA